MTTKPKRKRPKVRYIARGYNVLTRIENGRGTWIFATSYSTSVARRIASALNFHTAALKGELE